MHNTYRSVSSILLSVVAIFLHSPGAGTPVVADTIVVPIGFETTDGGTPGGGDSIPPRRVMLVINADQFSNLDSPLLITEVAYRPSNTQVGPSSGTEFNFRQFMSTTSRSAATLSTAFVDNMGPDHTEVGFWETITLPSANTPGPGDTREFDIIFPLQTPFRYDPTVGNLLLEAQIGPPESTFDNGILDLVAGHPGINFLVGLGAPDAATGEIQGAAPVVRFTFQPVPEPSTVFLFGAGVMVLGLLGYRGQTRRKLT